MRLADRPLARTLGTRLQEYEYRFDFLPGIQTESRRESLIEQMVESDRRIRFVSVVRQRGVSPHCTNPLSPLFDPLKAAISLQSNSNIEEAFWMVFYFVHFGKHPRTGWTNARNIYGRLGQSPNWDWPTTSTDPQGFRRWLNTNQETLHAPGVKGGFGNHRKYQSLKAYSPTGTGSAFETYIAWVSPPRTHTDMITQAHQTANGDPHRAFADLYASMSGVASFGRVARFDYLTMLGKLNLAPIEPGTPYLQNSTGPIHGARLLFGQKYTPSHLNHHATKLAIQLDVPMQVMEDALCNWQKSPQKFVPFRG